MVGTKRRDRHVSLLEWDMDWDNSFGARSTSDEGVRYCIWPKADGDLIGEHAAARREHDAAVGLFDEARQISAKFEGTDGHTSSRP
jgi:hypothetical protein